MKRIDVEVGVEVDVEVGDEVRVKARVVITRICAYLQDYLICYNYVITRTRQSSGRPGGGHLLTSAARVNNGGTGPCAAIDSRE